MGSDLSLSLSCIVEVGVGLELLVPGIPWIPDIVRTIDAKDRPCLRVVLSNHIKPVNSRIKRLHVCMSAFVSRHIHDLETGYPWTFSIHIALPILILNAINCSVPPEPQTLLTASQSSPL
jgi:hypothetical protein